MNERHLLNNLLQYYNSLQWPVYNESEAVELMFGLTLQQIIGVVSLSISKAEVWADSAAKYWCGELVYI